MIAGVRQQADPLSRGDALQRLADVGLDYVVVPWGVTESLHTTIFGADDFAQLPDVLREIRRLEMCPVVEIPLFVESEDVLDENIDRLTEWGIQHVEVFAIATTGGDRSADDEAAPFAAHQLRQIAAWVEEMADQRPLQTIWLPPVGCASASSVTELARRGPRAGGDVSIRVEPDGRVIPPRGPYQAAGNLLDQPWDDIWQHPVFTRYRERVEQGTRCDQCPGLAICAADCPADPNSWANES